MAQLKEQNKTPDKQLNEMEITNLPDEEFKTLVIRMLKELIEYGNSIKNTQSEMKVTLSEILKKIYKESTVEGMKLRIKPTTRNIRKKKHSTRIARRKKNFKK